MRKQSLTTILELLFPFWGITSKMGIYYDQQNADLLVVPLFDVSSN